VGSTVTTPNAKWNAWPTANRAKTSEQCCIRYAQCVSRFTSVCTTLSLILTEKGIAPIDARVLTHTSPAVQIPHARDWQAAGSNGRCPPRVDWLGRQSLTGNRHNCGQQRCLGYRGRSSSPVRESESNFCPRSSYWTVGEATIICFAARKLDVTAASRGHECNWRIMKWL